MSQSSVHPNVRTAPSQRNPFLTKRRGEYEPQQVQLLNQRPTCKARTQQTTRKDEQEGCGCASDKNSARAVVKYSTPPGLCLRRCSKIGDQNFFGTACQVQERDAPHSCACSAGAREPVACWPKGQGLAHLPRNTWLQSRLSSGYITAIKTVVTINTFVTTRSAVQLRAGTITGPVAFLMNWKRQHYDIERDSTTQANQIQKTSHRFPSRSTTCCTHVKAHRTWPRTTSSLHSHCLFLASRTINLQNTFTTEQQDLECLSTSPPP